MSHQPRPVGDFLTISELTARWHISRTTLWRWTRHGVPRADVRLNPINFGRTVLFHRATVNRIEATLASRHVGGRA